MIIVLCVSWQAEVPGQLECCGPLCCMLYIDTGIRTGLTRACKTQCMVYCRKMFLFRMGHIRPWQGRGYVQEGISIIIAPPPSPLLYQCDGNESVIIIKIHGIHVLVLQVPEFKK